MLLGWSLLVLMLSLEVHAASFAGEVQRSRAHSFGPNKVNAAIVAKLREAWDLAGHGKSNHEAAVVILQRDNGEYEAVVALDREGYRSIRLIVPPGAVAIFHTHPNYTAGEPSPQDRSNSDLLGIPNFTLTDRGVWGYDPIERRTSRLMYRLSWLDPRNWAAEFGAAQEARP